MKVLNLVSRWLAAILVGITVFVLSSLSVWRMSDSTIMDNDMVNNWTWTALMATDSLIMERIEQGGSPPQSLQEISSDLRNTTFDHSRIKILRKGVPIDGWGRPIIYSVDGTSYKVTSYGRDGKPGGTGLDRDQHRSHYEWIGQATEEAPIHTDPPMPSLRQFIFELPPGKGMLRACFLSGVIAFITALFLIRPARTSKVRASALIIQIAGVILVSIFFATMIMQLHIPSGH